jgi:hypothetical protein
VVDRSDLVRGRTSRLQGGAPRHAGAALLGLVCIAAILRFYRIGHQSLWVDEILTLQAAEVGGRLTAAAFFRNVQGPLHALLVHLVGSASVSEAALRSISAVAGTATVPVLYLLGRDLGRRSSGLIAAALGAVSPFGVWYSQEVRNYALLVFFAALSTLFMTRLVLGRTRSWTGYVASIVLAAYCNMAGLFLAIAHAAWAGVKAAGDRRFARGWAIALLVTLVLIGPAVWGIVGWAREDDVGGRMALAPAAEGGELVRGETTFTPFAVPYSLFALWYGYSLGPSLQELHTTPPLAAFLADWWLVVPAAAAAFAALLGLRALAGDRQRLGLSVAVLLVAFGGAIALALMNVKPMNARYVSTALPVLLVLCGAGIALLRRGPAVVVGGLMAVFSLVSLANYYARPEYSREDVRGAARYVEANERPGDAVLLPVIKDVFEFYYRGRATTVVIYPGQAGSDAEVASRIEDGVRGRARLWFVEARLWHTDPAGRIPAYLNGRYRLVEERELAGTRLFLYDLGEAPG